MVDVSKASQTFLDAANTELTNRSRKPKRSGLVPAAIAWDECDQCGLLALAINRTFLTDEFPTEATTADTCEGSILAVDYSMQIIRCAPTVNDKGDAPSVTALNDCALISIDDADAVMCSVIAALRDYYFQQEIDNYMIRQQIFVGPFGACVGSELQFVVGFQR